MQYARFFGSNQLADTQHLNATLKSIYYTLWAWYVHNGKPLPTNVSEIERFVRSHSIRLSSGRNEVLTVLQEFFVLSTDGWHHAELDRQKTAFTGAVERKLSAKRAQTERKQGGVFQGNQGLENTRMNDLRRNECSASLHSPLNEAHEVSLPDEVVSAKTDGTPAAPITGGVSTNPTPIYDLGHFNRALQRYTSVFGKPKPAALAQIRRLKSAPAILERAVDEGISLEELLDD